MIIFSDVAKNVFFIKLKIIGSLLIAACIDQFNFFHLVPLQPNFFFLTLYFWCFFFNHYLSFTLVFLFGLLVDLMGGSFLGENTLTFILLYGSISFYQEHYSKDPDLEWNILSVAVGSLTIFQILMLSLIHQRFVFSWRHLVENGLMFVFYPCIKYGLHWLMKERRSS
ncbi:MAG: hypothetical protein A2977_04065 [Alphaproteobacteria bacterium RIFCSPLOWO2_01_FULL_45_8]|nr:MAG: hypothetical protein A3K20_04415 [Alphaproteobacteria bacterium GWA1_45_9]OFW89903.1 MAG: hypothetical protein A2621_03390 [Alphaproteobacteria bacterium RIFCSPHIGHO2_01_FULL_41_14]OFW96026.1 MAG: hypothetical protein A2977_04065 [Alphaproteobacteria bacterium RIFCSPLOWO2_01_FULL_45_8]HCI48340.1 hypothetical protein [Holosporales bacterium]HLB59678.1 rod shape-determining protein MreD [Bdellovibrionota bacterium]